MGWTEKYWDAIDDFYWTPDYLGLKSIPQKYWVTGETTVAIPKDMTNPKGPLYRRLRTGDEFWGYVRRQEETFNHIFNITFSILPGDVVSEIFSAFVGSVSGNNYESLGLDQRSRYEWGKHENITTPDGFFVANDSLLAIEIKFNAKTSLDQLAKYLVMFASEENLTGQRHQIDLLFIFNGDANDKFLKQTGIECDRVDVSTYGDLRNALRNTELTRFFDQHQTHIESLLERINIRCIDWQDFSTALTNFCAGLSMEQGDRTIRRLLDGLIAEIHSHPLSNASTQS